MGRSICLALGLRMSEGTVLLGEEAGERCGVKVAAIMGIVSVLEMLLLVVGMMLMWMVMMLLL